ncbi:MAG TPA: hypothetical protein VIS94_09725 [Desulfomonilia bacterium]
MKTEKKERKVIEKNSTKSSCSSIKTDNSEKKESSSNTTYESVTKGMPFTIKLY